MSCLVIPGDSSAGSLVRPDKAMVKFCVVSKLRLSGGICVSNLFGTSGLNKVLSNSY